MWRSSFRYNPKTQVCYRRLAFLGFPWYRIGDDGSVWSRLHWTCKGLKLGERSFYQGDWKKLKPWNRGNYLGIGLRRTDHSLKKFYVHHLVLLAFAGPCPTGREACHFPDQSTKNNRLENLFWGTKNENMSHKEVNGTAPKGENNGAAVLTEKEVLKIRRLMNSGKRTIPELARRYGVKYNTIKFIIKRETWKHI